MNINQAYLALRKRILRLLKGKYFVVRRGGLFFLMDIYNFIDRQIEAHGTYEEDLILPFIDDVKQIGCEYFLDIGANLGLYSLRIATSIPNISVLAFEPDLRNFSQLQANIFLNELEDKVRAERIALSDKDGETRFHRHESENRGRSKITDNGDLMVLTKRIDDFLPFSGKRVAIKIDVEGHELNVIRGAENFLRNNNCIVQIETFSLAQVQEFMTGIRYTLSRQKGNDYIFITSNK